MAPHARHFPRACHYHRPGESRRQQFASAALAHRASQRGSSRRTRCGRGTEPSRAWRARRRGERVVSVSSALPSSADASAAYSAPGSIRVPAARPFLAQPRPLCRELRGPPIAPGCRAKIFAGSSHARPKAADKTGRCSGIPPRHQGADANGTSRDRHGIGRHLDIFVNQELARTPGRQKG